MFWSELSSVWATSAQFELWITIKYLPSMTPVNRHYHLITKYVHLNSQRSWDTSIHWRHNHKFDLPCEVGRNSTVYSPILTVVQVKSEAASSRPSILPYLVDKIKRVTMEFACLFNQYLSFFRYLFYLIHIDHWLIVW